MLADALEHLVRGVVDHPDDVSVRDKQLRRGSILEVRVHPDDLGKVIGRNGRTATAFRTVVSALAGRGGARIDFVDVDRRAEPAPSSPRAPPLGVAPVVMSGVVSETHQPSSAVAADRPSASRSSSAGSASRTACAARSPSRCAPTSPNGASPPGTTLAPSPPAAPRPAARRSTIAAPRWHQSTLLVTLRRDRRPQRRRGRPRHRAARRPRRRRVARGPRGVLRPPAGRARRGRPRRHAARQVTGVVHGGARTCSTSVRPTAATRWCRSWPRWCPRSTSPAAASSSPTGRAWWRRSPTSRRRLTGDADRRRLDLPRLPRAAGALACPARPATSGLLDLARPRPARLDARPAPHGRRHALRRRRRHGDEARALGRGARRGRARRRRPIARRTDARAGTPFTQARRPRARRAATTWSSPAAATRASTSG